jgi:6-phosphogluconolactonase
MFLSFAMAARAETFVYLSLAPEKQIVVCRLNPADGSLKEIERVAVAGSPGCLTLDPGKKHLCASLRSTGQLASFAVDPKTGKLAPRSTVEIGKNDNAAFLRTDRTGRWLFSASYTGGKIAVHELKDGKILAPPTQIVETAKTAHSVAVDPDNRWVFAPHVAPNAVYQFHFDAATGKLTDAGKADAGAPMAGPRHFAWRPDHRFAYTSDEVKNTITAYSFDPKRGLNAIDNATTLPGDFTHKNTTAEVKVHPNGKFVWVSNRGHDSLAGFAIDEKTGKLTPLGQTPVEPTPRSFEFDPAGKFLFAAGEGNGKLAIFHVDAATGKLTRAGTMEVGKSLTWVLAVDL